MSGRSGTTLMMELLATSGDIFFDRQYPYENRYLTYLLHLMRPLSLPQGGESGWDMAALVSRDPARTGPLPFRPCHFTAADLHGRAFQHAWLAFSECVAATTAPPPRFYAEKAGVQAAPPGELAGAGVPFRAIHVLRDPRDVFASIRSFDARRGFYGFGRAPDEDWAGYLTRFAGVMRRRLELMEAERLGGADVTVVRYEDLAADLPASAALLSGWLGAPLDASAALGSRDRNSAHVTSASAAASVGRWRDDLADWERGLIEGQLGPDMRALGYT